MSSAVPPLRVAVIGLGMVAQLVYVPLLQRRRDRFHVVALCDPNAAARDAVGDQLGVASQDRVATVDEIARRTDLDGALVLTSGSHAPASRALLDAGVPVLVEKPLAYTLAEVDTLAQGADRLLLGYMKLFDPAVQAAVAAVDELGPLRAADVTVLHPSNERQIHHLGWNPPPPPPADPAQARDLARLQTDALGPEAAEQLGPIYTNVLLGSVVHDLAVLRSLIGDPQAVDRAEHWEGPSGLSVGFDGRAGDVRVSMRWHLLPEHPSYREEVRLHGEHGSLRLEFPAPYVLHAPTQFELTAADGPDEKRISRISYGEAFARQLDAFEQMARGVAAPASSVAEGRADVLTCQRIASALAGAKGLPISGEAAAS